MGRTGSRRKEVTARAEKDLLEIVLLLCVCKKGLVKHSYRESLGEIKVICKILLLEGPFLLWICFLNSVIILRLHHNNFFSVQPISLIRKEFQKLMERMTDEELEDWIKLLKHYVK